MNILIDLKSQFYIDFNNFQLVYKFKMIPYVLLLLFTLTIHLVTPQTLPQFKAQIQTKIQAIADQMSNIYSSRCGADIQSCSNRSYYECQGTDEKINYPDFPNPFDCVGNGAYMSQTSAVRIPPSASTSSLTTSQQQFICASSKLEDTFHALNTDRDQRYGSSYVGTIDGITRIYPGSYMGSESCKNYDPRFRPWYIAATSGGKNIILVVDVSTSMEKRKGINLAKTAAKTVIDTLSNNDFIGVIAFSQNSTSLVTDKITRATQDHKEQLNRAIDQIKASGGTNYESALRKTFQMFDSAQSDEFGSPCLNATNLVLFLTDGYPGIDEITTEGILAIISSINKVQAKIFTYALGNLVRQDILQAVACANEGIMFRADENIDQNSLTEIMMEYHKYLSSGIQVSKPVWTEPYTDFGGFGFMVTVSMPIYYNEDGVRYLLGVAGIDVTMKTLRQFGLNDEQITKSLLSDSTCLNPTLTECQLQQMRPIYSKCSNINCGNATSIRGCGSTIGSGSIFMQVINQDQNICNGITIGGIVGVIIASIIVLHIVVGLIVFIYQLSVKKNI